MSCCNGMRLTVLWVNAPLLGQKIKTCDGCWDNLVNNTDASVAIVAFILTEP